MPRSFSNQCPSEINNNLGIITGESVHETIDIKSEIYKYQDKIFRNPSPVLERRCAALPIDATRRVELPVIPVLTTAAFALEQPPSIPDKLSSTGEQADQYKSASNIYLENRSAVTSNEGMPKRIRDIKVTSIGLKHDAAVFLTGAILPIDALDMPEIAATELAHCEVVGDAAAAAVTRPKNEGYEGCDATPLPDNTITFPEVAPYIVVRAPGAAAVPIVVADATEGAQYRSQDDTGQDSADIALTSNPESLFGPELIRREEEVEGFEGSDLEEERSINSPSLLLKSASSRKSDHFQFNYDPTLGAVKKRQIRERRYSSPRSSAKVSTVTTATVTERVSKIRTLPASHLLQSSDGTPGAEVHDSQQPDAK